jgi:hypothetical protein
MGDLFSADLTCTAQDEFTSLAGFDTNMRSVTVCSSSLTGQDVGRCKITRSLNCLTCTAILNSFEMTVDGCALASPVCRNAWVRNC